MTGVPTTNYGFSKIDFNSRPWDSDEHANWDLLDAILYTIAQVPNIAGVWRNSTQYQVGQNVLDPNTLVFYQCLVANVSAATGTFAADRTANPANWTLTNSGQGSVRYDMGQALSGAQILQAQNNLNLFAQFLRFDTPQTLTYNNMLQVLNTLGIDGLESGIASAATTDISNVNTQAVAITGTTTITSLGVRPNKYKLLRFTGSLTLTNSSTLNLPGGANIVTQAGDTCVAFSDSATPTASWTIRGYSRADGTLVIGKPVLPTPQTFTATEQLIARNNIGAAYAEDLKSALIQIARLRGTSLGTPNYLVDDFNDSSGIDTANAVNANVQGGVVLNQATDANTKALLHFDGVNNSTTISDDVPGHTWSVVNNAKLSTAQFVFGTASLLITSGSDAAVATASTDFSPSGDFTIEFRYRPASFSGGTAFDMHSGSLGYYVNVSSTAKVVVVNGAGTNVIVGTTTLVANTTYAIAVTRSGSTVRLFINGSLDGSGTDSTAFSASPPIYIGNNTAGSSPQPGYYDEFRLSNTARYTAAYTPAASAFSYGTSGVLTLPSVTATGVSVAPTKVSMYALVKQTAGTLTMNTNMVFSASRDNGTTYTQFTLANIGNYGGYTIYEQNLLDISAQPTGTSPRYKTITNDVALGIAIDAVLFQWG